MSYTSEEVEAAKAELKWLRGAYDYSIKQANLKAAELRREALRKHLPGIQKAIEVIMSSSKLSEVGRIWGTTHYPTLRALEAGKLPEYRSDK